MKRAVLVSLVLVAAMELGCSKRTWPDLWKSYAAAFLDDQVRVIDRDARDRTTSEGQAYAMFFALVANDQPRFDALLGWTERNLAAGDLRLRLPAWLWGRGSENAWDVLDLNSAADADLWMAYSLLEAGRAWKDARYTSIGTALARRIAENETADLPDIGVVFLPGANGFRHGQTVRLNASYMPLQLFIRLAHLLPDGPWGRIAERIPMLVRGSSPASVPTDWLDVGPGAKFQPSPIGSYDAVRIYLWAGMLDRATAGRDDLLHAISGIVGQLRHQPRPPAKITTAGQVADAQGPIGFSAALLPYLTALGETTIAREQMARLKSAADPKTGLYGMPARYYDQNLALFGIGAFEHEFWFDAAGELHTQWNR